MLGYEHMSFSWKKKTYPITAFWHKEIFNLSIHITLPNVASIPEMNTFPWATAVILFRFLLQFPVGIAFGSITYLFAGMPVYMPILIVIIFIKIYIYIF